MDLDVLWSKILEQIKEELSSLSFDTWFSDTKLYKLENDKAFIIVPMAIHKRYLSENYNDIDSLNSLLELAKSEPYRPISACY